MVNELDYNIVRSKLKLKSRYYTYFQTNDQGKRINSALPPSNGLSSTTIVLLQG